MVDTLMSPSAIDSEQSVVVYFYCNHSDATTLDALQIYGSFILQLLLCRSLKEIPEEIERKIDKAYQDGRRTPDAEELLDILLLVLKLFKKVYIILDGIDECGGDDRVDCLMLIKSLDQVEQTVVKLLVSSRADADLKRAFKDDIHLRVSSDSTSLDIESFVNGIVQQKVTSGELKVRDPTLVDRIVEALVKGAQGMYVYTQLFCFCSSLPYFIKMLIPLGSYG